MVIVVQFGFSSCWLNFGALPRVFTVCMDDYHEQKHKTTDMDSTGTTTLVQATFTTATPVATRSVNDAHGGCQVSTTTMKDRLQAKRQVLQRVKRHRVFCACFSCVHPVCRFNACFYRVSSVCRFNACFYRVPSVCRCNACFFASVRFVVLVRVSIACFRFVVLVRAFIAYYRCVLSVRVRLCLRVSAPAMKIPL